MANRLNFSIAVNLLTDGVKTGATKAVQSLKSIQMQALTFMAAIGGASIGIGSFVSKLIDTARETNRVTVSLKNVSSGLKGFADNQKWLLGLSGKYGVEINALTGNFSKFTAAATSAGVSMNDQKKIFESMSRASVGFGLSSEETNLAFLAVTQMMSKGKISSEELRRQLGEKIPIAMTAMARAAGVGVSGLDKLLKQGKLMSADILPKFADAMNEMMPNVSTDNIETSINRLKNAFVAFTKGTGTQEAFKKVVDEIGKLVQFASDNIKNIVNGLVSFIVGIFGGKLFTAVAAYFANASALFKDNAVQAGIQSEIAEANILVATQKRVEAQKLLEMANLRFSKATGEAKLSSQVVITDAQIAMDEAVAMEERAILAQTAAAAKASQAASVTGFRSVSASVGAAFKGVGSVIGSTLKMLAPMAIIMGVMAIVTTLVAWRKEQKRINDLYTEYQGKAKSAGKNTAAGNELSNLKRIYEDINRPLAERKTALNSINTALGTNYEFNLKDKKLQKEINAEYEKRLKLIEARAKYEFYTDRVLKATASNDDLAQKNTGRIETQKQSVKDLIYGKFGNGDLSQKYIGQLSNILETGKGSVSDKFLKLFDNFKTNAAGGEYNDNKLDAILNSNQRGWEAFNTSAEVLANNRIIVSATDSKNKIKTDFGALVGDEGGLKGSDLGNGPAADTTDLAKAEKSYTEKVNQLTNQLANKTIAETEYAKSLDELNKETQKTIGGLIDPKAAATNAVYQKASAGVKNPLYTKTDEAVEEFTKEQTKYNLQLNALTRRKELALVSDEDYSKALNNLVDSTTDNVLSIDGIGKSADEFVKKLNAAKIPELKDFKTPNLSTVDNTFNYKKTGSEKAQDRVDTNLDNIDKISSAFDKMGIDEVQKKIIDAGGNLDTLRGQFSGESQKMFDELTRLMKETPDLSKAMKILQIREDIKDLQTQLNEGVYSTIKNIGGSARNIVSAFQNLKDVMEAPDASGWDKFFSVWDTFFTIVDGIIGTVTAIESLIEVFNSLKAAKDVVKPVKAGTDLVEIGANALITASDTLKTTTLVANSGAQVVANKAATVSYAQLMAAETAATYATIPGGGIIALAQIELLKAAIAGAGLQAFANGGIVGGSSFHGDHTLVAANAGELILNRIQQSAVLGQMNKGNVLSGEVRLRGSDIFMSLSNHMKKNSLKLP